MGSQIFHFWSKKSISLTNLQLLILGPGSVGKTTILYQLQEKEIINIKPTVGFNVEELNYQKIKLIVWDLEGGDKIRCLWKHYYPFTDGLIFVVDSNEKDKYIIEDSIVELKKLLEEEELKTVPVLIFANKQDLNGAFSPKKIIDLYQIPELKKRKWFVQGISAITGKGIMEGLKWITENNFYNSIII